MLKFRDETERLGHIIRDESVDLCTEEMLLGAFLVSRPHQRFFPFIVNGVYRIGRCRFLLKTYVVTVELCCVAHRRKCQKTCLDLRIFCLYVIDNVILK